MPRTTTADAAIARLSRTQMRLATSRQLRATGLAAGTAVGRCAPGGPWQRLLPGVVLIQTGEPTTRQRLLAAVLYACGGTGAGADAGAGAGTDTDTGADAGTGTGVDAGTGTGVDAGTGTGVDAGTGTGTGVDAGPTALSGAKAVLTGESALSLYGVRGAETEHADVLIGARRGLRDKQYVRLRRTSRWPPTLLLNGIPCVRPVRAAADFAAHEPSTERVRAILATTVQTCSCHPEDLRAELHASHALRNPAVRPVLDELRAGTRSIAEGEARATLLAAGLPHPLWNPVLRTPTGAFLARPDAYWAFAGVALEVDSEEFHLGVTAYRATLRRRLLLEAHGVDVVSAAPALIRDHPEELIAALRAKLHQAKSRPTLPNVIVRPYL